MYLIVFTILTEKRHYYEYKPIHYLSIANVHLSQFALKYTAYTFNVYIWYIF